MTNTQGSTTEVLLKSAVRLAGLGLWTWDFRAGRIELSPGAQQIFGSGVLDGTFASWLRSVDPADARALQEIEERMRSGQRTFSFEYRFARPDGAQRWLKIDGELASRDEAGRPLMLAGTVLDLGSAEARARSPATPGTLLEAADTWTWEQDASLRFTRFHGGNQTAVPELAEGIGRRRWELPHAVPLNASWHQHMQALERQEPIRGFEYGVGAWPHTTYVSVSGDPVRDASGAFQGYRGIAQNITRRVRAERAAIYSSILLRQASRLGHLGGWSLRVSDLEVEWTEESRAIFGRSGEAPLSWEEALAQLEEADRAKLQRSVLDCVVQAAAFTVEARLGTPDGGAKWLRILGEPEPAFMGSVRRVIGSVQDISGHVKAQDALRASEERHRLLVETSLDAIFQVEHESGRILAANPAACAMFRLSEAQLCERNRRDLIAPHDRRTERVLQEGRGQLMLVRGDGTRFEAELAAALFTASDGITYSSLIVHDLSEFLKYQGEILALNKGLARKNAGLAREVRERTAELESANDELKGFAHSLAHDLRAPIGVIHALGRALEQRLGSAAERERHYAARIGRAAQQLDAYVEALLSHARISQVPMRPKRVDLSATAEAVIADLRLRDPQRTVTTHVQPGLFAFGDPSLLRMALENLLGNAWKFTARRADAEIRFALAEVDGATGFCVSDNGAGFDMEFAHKLFGTFQRLHTQAEFPGTGIGLANVQRVIARHGGRIWAQGRENAGASFCFTLPQQP